MNIEGPGDPGTVWLSVMLAVITPVLFWRENAKGEAAIGLSNQLSYLPPFCATETTLNTSCLLGAIAVVGDSFTFLWILCKRDLSQASIPQINSKT